MAGEKAHRGTACEDAVGPQVVAVLRPRTCLKDAIHILPTPLSSYNAQSDRLSRRPRFTKIRTSDGKAFSLPPRDFVLQNGRIFLRVRNLSQGRIFRIVHAHEDSS